LQRKQAQEDLAAQQDLQWERPPVFLFLEILRMMGAKQTMGPTLSERDDRIANAGNDYLLQIRQLNTNIVGIHQDVCVHDACYTTGPSEGIYRRDPSASRWALTDADGWGTSRGNWLFINANELSACRDFMDRQIVGTSTRSDFWANVGEYIANGLCITFSNRCFKEMVDMCIRMRGGSA
jgi:hypothetical protein